MGVPILANQWINDDDFDDDDDDSGQKAPEKLPAAARKHMRALEKERNELKSRLDEIEKGQRKTTVKSVVEAKGYDPRIAAFIPSDVEASEDAVTKWLGEYADVFAVKKNDSDGSGVDQVDPGMVQAMQQMGMATNQAQMVTKPQDLMAQINGADTPEKLKAILRANGATQLM